MLTQKWYKYSLYDHIYDYMASPKNPPSEDPDIVAGCVLVAFLLFALISVIVDNIPYFKIAALYLVTLQLLLS